MITIITGTPGTGKTSLVISMLRDEVVKGRRIYTKGIPELKLPILNAGNPTTWQAGTWLKIDSYNVDSDDDPAEDDGDLMMVESRWQANGNDQSDHGALIVIDEAQSYFRPRSTGKRVPDCIGAFEVHRHQGLDFWLITQRPNLIDSNIRGLTTRHIHLHRGPFGVAKIEWAECQDPSSKASRSLGNRSRYKPDPKVFDLYKSAAEHTKVKVKLPNVFWMLVFALVGLVVMVFVIKDRLGSKLNLDTLGKPAVAASVLPSSIDHPLTVPPEGEGEARQAPEPADGTVNISRSDSLFSPDPVFSGCFATPKKCACQLSDGADAGFSTSECLAELGIDSLPARSGMSGSELLAFQSVPRFWAFAERDFKRLHPNKRWIDAKIYIAGVEKGFYK